jgi:hypothetical protein
MHEIGDYLVEYLREFEAELKKALARDSGAQREIIGNPVTLSL